MKLKLHLLKLLFVGVLFSVSLSVNAQYVGIPYNGVGNELEIGASPDTAYRMELENFDKTAADTDAEGVNAASSTTPPDDTATYYDDDSVSTGDNDGEGDSSYRAGTSVDIKAGGSGQVITDHSNGEYTLQTVEIMETGNYTVKVNYAHGGSNKEMDLLLLTHAGGVSDDFTTAVTIMNNVTIPATGNSSTYADYTVTDVAITAGTYVVQTKYRDSGPNFDYVEFTRVVNPDATGGAYNGPHTVDIAGVLTVQAEDFDIGSNANGGSSPYGYYDAQIVDNDPEVYRPTQKVIQDDGGVISLADCRPGEYTYYTLTIPVGHGGTYAARVKYKSGGSGKTIQMHLMSDDLIEGDLMFDETGGVTSGYENLIGDETFTLSEGTQVVRLKANNAAPAIDSFSIATLANIIGLDDIESVDNSLKAYPNPSDSGVFSLKMAADWEIFSLTGVKVLEGNGTSIDAGNLANGSYILKIANTSQIIVIN